MKKAQTSHLEQRDRLMKVEGQVRGILKMIDEQRYCVDIINQIHSVQSAIRAVEREIVRKHIEGCVESAMGGGSPRERVRKLREIADLLDAACR